MSLNFILGTKQMNKIFLNTAKKFQSGDEDELQQAIEEALSGQRPVIEELLNRELVPEEDFLKGLAEELHWDGRIALTLSIKEN